VEVNERWGGGGVINRKKGIGGTDISAIVGLNPHKTKLDVWLDKTGQKEDQPDNENMWWGREMEPVLAKRYEKETARKIVVPPATILPATHPKSQWYKGSPDALFVPEWREIKSSNISVIKSEGGVDFKTSGRPQDWGEPGTDEVPEHYLIQAEWYMGLTGAQWWDIAVLLMGFARKFAIYRINRDNGLIEMLTEAGKKFWTDHVLTGTPPEIDGSKSATEYLKKKYPFDSGPMLEPTDEEILAIVTDYQVTRRVLKQTEDYEAVLANRLKSFIGDAAGMQGSWGKITWRRSKDSTAFDSKKFQATCPDLAKDFLITKPGSRRWLPKFNQED
jgi:putative phage-type endonuclease